MEDDAFQSDGAFESTDQIHIDGPFLSQCSGDDFVHTHGHQGFSLMEDGPFFM